MKKKLITEWLNEITNKNVRAEALQNFKNSRNEDIEAHSIQNALTLAFSWVDSPQGHKYWDNFYMSLFTDF
jgi:hypothetical protein